MLPLVKGGIFLFLTSDMQMSQRIRRENVTLRFVGSKVTFLGL